MGIDPIEDKEFLYIGRDGLKAALPEPWRACRLKDDEICYYNPVSGEYKADHPLDDYYRSLFEQEKKLRNKKKQKNSGPSNFKAKFAQKLNMGSVLSSVTPIENTNNKTLPKPSIGQKIDNIPPIAKSAEVKNKSISIDDSFSENNSFILNNNPGGQYQFPSGNDNNFLKSANQDNPSPIMFKKNKNISDPQLDGSFDQEIFGNAGSKASKINIDNDYEQIDYEIEEKFLNFQKSKQKEMENKKIALNNELIPKSEEMNKHLNNDLEILKRDLSSNFQTSRMIFLKEKEIINKSMMEEYEIKYNQDSEKLKDQYNLALKDLEATENLNIDYELQNYENKLKNDFETQRLVNKWFS